MTAHYLLVFVRVGRVAPTNFMLAAVKNIIINMHKQIIDKLQNDIKPNQFSDIYLCKNKKKHYKYFEIDMKIANLICYQMLMRHIDNAMSPMINIKFDC